MTVVDDAPAAASATDRGIEGERPALADGVELIGEMEGSGFKEPPSLVRRADGQVIQLTPLLYAVAQRADGRHTLDEIADEVGNEIGRGVSGANVKTLVDAKLRPLGILRAADGSEPPIEKSNPLLALRFRTAVIPERVTNGLAAAFAPLFLPPIVVAVLIGLVVGDIWFFGTHGVAQALRNGMENPTTFLPVLAAVVLSAAFHEIGHAAGCRYGGGQPGKMGCGVYLAWPAFYTDVTDAYRLGKKGRLRTDLGGVYFNAIVILATYGIYFWTHSEVVLLLVVIQHFEIAHQLLPVVRLDGYYIVADLTGVPDLFNRIKPILVSALPWRKADERVTVLKPWVRVAVTVWVLVVVPLLLFQLLTVLLHLPRIVATAIASADKQLDAIGAAHGEIASIASGVLQLVALSIPVLGILLTVWMLAKSVAVGAWRRTAGRPIARTAVCVAGAGVVGLLLSAWLPRTGYRPIQPGERGTVGDSVVAARRVVQGRTPLAPPRGDPGGATEESDDPTAVTSTSVPVSSTSTSLPKGATVTSRPITASTTIRSTATSTPATTATTASSTSTSSRATTTTAAP